MPIQAVSNNDQNTLEDNAIEPHIALGKYEVKSRGIIVYRINSLEFAFGIYCLVARQESIPLPQGPRCLTLEYPTFISRAASFTIVIIGNINQGSSQ